GYGGQTHGGAIFNQGMLDVVACTFFGNRAVGQEGTITGGSEPEGLAQGGAIYTAGSLKLRESTLSGNFAQGSAGGSHGSEGFPGARGVGGGIWNSGDAAITNSTLSQNVARGGNGRLNSTGPGGPGIGGGLSNEGGTLTLVHCTLSENEAVGGIGNTIGSAFGGAIYTTNGAVTVNNSIVANSRSSSNCFGSVVDGGHNLSSDASCNLSAPGSLNNI